MSSQTRAEDRFDLSRWRIAGNGADMIRPDVMQAFVDCFAAAGFQAGAFCPSYGLAEATLAVSLMPPGEGIRLELVEEKELSGGEGDDDAGRPRRYRAVVNCGKPVAGMEIEVRAAEGDILPIAASARSIVRGASASWPAISATRNRPAPASATTVGSTPATWAICRTATSSSSAAPRT